MVSRSGTLTYEAVSYTHLDVYKRQTFASEVLDNDDSKHKPYQLDRCHALESHSETVKRFYPRWYRGQNLG